MEFELKMPALGMTMDEGRVVQWHAREGQTVAKGDVLLEIEAEKASFEVEAPADGTVTRILHGADAVVPVGTVLATLISAEAEAATTSAVSASSRSIRATPLAKRLARLQGVDLAGAVGSGPRAIVVAKDVPAAGSAAPPSVAADETPFVLRPLTPMRRTIAKRMAQSVESAPHFHLACKIGADALVRFREANIAAIRSETGVELTYTDLLLAATGRVLVGHRHLNATFTEQGIKEWRRINVSLAVEVEGGLIAPVLKDVDQLNLPELVQTRATAVARARAGQTTAEDMRGGTFGLSNLGAYGIDFFTSILIPGQTGMLSVGAIQDGAVVMAGQIVARKEMMIGLAIDHRAVDGAAGAAFLRDLRARIESGALLD